ncbi:hypothetical protein CCHL11_08581 [Colletotrichum chlorophyti]|uniref:Heterokaryon incompatibility domain-containing protein n=1 Tax=Colletotrichum chlorophyti TaxID=708187 RepID=A0A1Q8RAG3_9PEZI|nr:hypothetical protein CCHL11_08581 [Colletotrichum chlorophyti]
MRKEPLSERAWGLQERVLSRRVLHFGSEQMYWECLEGFETEEGLKLPFRLPAVSTDPEIIAYMKERELDNAHSFGGTDKSTTHMQTWSHILSKYGRRKLGNPQDKLPAISGVARSFSKELNDEYLAGLWRKSLIEGLCWQPLNCKPAEGGYRAPSWSWASVDGVPATGFIGDHVEEQANILETKVDIDGENPFGRVHDGWIKVEAPLVKMVLSENKGPTGHILLRSEKGEGDFYAMLDTIDRSYDSSAGLIQSMELYALILAFTYGSPFHSDSERKEPIAHGLIVTPATDRPGRLRRIGMVVQSPAYFGPGELEVSRSTVIVV